MSEIGIDEDSIMENIKEKALKELSIKFIHESYNKDEKDNIRNTMFLENNWLEEKIKTDTIKNISHIIIMLPNNTYYKFDSYHITFLLDNYRLNKSFVEDNSFFSSLFGSSKKKLDNPNKYTFYIYTKEYIYYTNCNQLENGNYFTIIPR